MSFARVFKRINKYTKKLHKLSFTDILRKKKFVYSYVINIKVYNSTINKFVRGMCCSQLLSLFTSALLTQEADFRILTTSLISGDIWHWRLLCQWMNFKYAFIVGLYSIIDVRRERFLIHQPQQTVFYPQFKCFGFPECSAWVQLYIFYCQIILLSR